MKQYLDAVRHVLNTGTIKNDRTGIGTFSTFGYQMWFNLQHGFPLLTTKKVRFSDILTELLWFLKGDTNVKYLNDHGCTIWNEWADQNDDLGPIYGHQWRSWGSFLPSHGIDQIRNAQSRIRDNPDCRRIIVSAWAVEDLNAMALQPCHVMFQFNVTNGRLSCHMYQRSADIFLGVPYNIASYALLTLMMAKTTGYDPGELIISYGDLHLYLNHQEQATEQLSRKPMMLPEVWIDPTVTDILDFKHEHFKLIDYRHHPAIKADVAV